MGTPLRPASTSPLPWAFEPHEMGAPEIEDARGGRVTGLCNRAGDYDVDPQDAAYIIHAANTHPRLVAELRRAKEALRGVAFARRQDIRRDVYEKCVAALASIDATLAECGEGK